MALMDALEEQEDAGLASWVEARHAQIDRGELCYIAHQLDMAGYAPRPAP